MAVSDRAGASELGLLDAVLETSPSVVTARGELDDFHQAPSAERALFTWLDACVPGWRRLTKVQVVRLLNRQVAQIDALLNAQVNAILHHPRFQALEGSWRGLKYLVVQSDDDQVRIRVLNASWRELARDFERAAEFDQSALFQKVYNEEFGIAGGEPFSVLLGDYEVQPRPGPGHPVDDVSTLRAISQVAAAAFAPFIAAANPAMLGLEDFADLQRPMDLLRSFEQVEYVKWNAFRDSEDARFVGLTLPRVLMRSPWADDGGRSDGFRFREEFRRADAREHLWGNACYAFGAVLVRAFSQNGWLADIRGVVPGQETGGLVTGLPAPSFPEEKAGIAPRSSTDAVITDVQEKLLGELGFIPLSRCKDTGLSAFFGNRSVQQPKRYDRPEATTNARLSATLQYMLCVSRFAHYIKIIGRDKVGSLTEAGELERYLDKWFVDYILDSTDASPEMKAKHPLREARVQVREHPGKPGAYLLTIHLRPHFQLDELSASVRLVTELALPEPPR
jgi:type VI secretion system ImpC/EvpB family protein